METITEVRITETERTALTRLLAKARTEGVKLVRDQDGRHFATSTSTPGRRYLVTGYSCTCRGFIAHQRCKHLAALLAAKGWFLDDPNPDPAGAVLPTCAACMDAGMIDAPRSRWIGGCQTGYRDEWTSPTPCPRCQPVAA